MLQSCGLTSVEILERFRRDHADQTRGSTGDIDLTLRPAYLDLLKKLGDPHKKVPPIFHVAGTNGKGSTCAFLRAMLEAAGYKVHVYTSPHLVRFHERIRIAGKLITEDELTDILSECQKLVEPGTITYFEAATAAAFVAFARHPADYMILEVGLGGRLDATNVIDKPIADIITRISHDHRDYLGEDLAGIAREKAGIMRAGIPCFIAPQPNENVREALKDASRKTHAPLVFGGEDWEVERLENGFRYRDPVRTLDLPMPGLIGDHQLWNAGLAIAALSVLPKPLPPTALAQGLQNVEWHARLQKIEHGALCRLLPQDWELWLDGGHNDSAGEVLARQAEIWASADDGIIRPLHMICGMLTTKNPVEFLTPLAPYVSEMLAVPIESEPTSFSAEDLAIKASAAGIKKGALCANLEQALRQLGRSPHVMGRVLVCGSLYLAGEFLRANE